MKSTTKKRETTSSEKPCFATRLGELLKETKTKQETLANYLGFKHQQISSYKHGKTSPDIETVCKIAKYFNVSTDYLLGVSEIKSNSPNMIDIHNRLGLSEETITRLSEQMEYLYKITNTNSPGEALKKFNQIQRALISSTANHSFEKIAKARKLNIDTNNSDEVLIASDFVPYSYVIDKMVNDKSQSAVLGELYDLIMFMEADYVNCMPLKYGDFEDVFAILLVRLQRAFTAWTNHELGREE